MLAVIVYYDRKFVTYHVWQCPIPPVDRKKSSNHILLLQKENKILVSHVKISKSSNKSPQKDISKVNSGVMSLWILISVYSSSIVVKIYIVYDSTLTSIAYRAHEEKHIEEINRVGVRVCMCERCTSIGIGDEIIFIFSCTKTECKTIFFS